MELLKIYTMLLRRRWLVVQSVLFLTLAAGALALLLPKNYRASARVLVSSNDASLSILSDLGMSEIAAGLSSSTDNVQNKIQLATARPVLDEVIWRLQLRDGDGALYTYEEFLIAGMFGEFEARPNIEVTQQQGTDILVFEARADDPELSRLMADTVVRVAVQRSQERARAETRSARLFIQDQLEVVSSEFDHALSVIADAQAAESVIDLESEMKAAIGRLSEMLLSFETNAANIQELRAKIAEQKAYQRQETVSQISPLTTAQNNRVQLLTEHMEHLKQEQAAERTVKTERHPDVQRYDELIAAAQTQLSQAIDEQHAMDPALQQLEAELAGLRNKGREIDASIQRITSDFSKYPEKMRKISVLQLAATAAESVYKSLQEQHFQIGVAEAMLVSDLQLVEPAMAPDRHVSPKLMVNLVFGFGLGCCLGLGLALLFEYVDDTVKTPADLPDIWDAPRLGIIPRFKLDGDRRIIDALSATDPITEAYRNVRNGLMYASLDQPLHVIGVTSALPGEGKSTFTMNLAISFAREGKRVIVVDCDMRRPIQQRAFSDVTNRVGLTDVLTGKMNLDAVVQDTSVHNLSLLTSGSIPTDPARLIESLRLRQLLLDLGKIYDVVVVDTPPVLVVGDALAIARAVDGMIVVVESSRTSRKLIVELRDRFQSAGMEPLGLVVNKMDYYTSGYGAYLKAYKDYAQPPPDAGDGPEEVSDVTGGSGVA